MRKVIQVTTYPFGLCGLKPRKTLESSGCEVRYNPHGRRLKASEVPELVSDAHGIIAGTEPYTQEVIKRAKNLEVIARVGVGLDSVDIETCRQRRIVVTFTPEAPADAVAELTVAHILNLLRGIHESDRSVREGTWNRYLGRLIREVAIGILGVGRIGKRVARLLGPFSPQLYGCDVEPDLEFGQQVGLTWLNHQELFEACDLVTLHVPLVAQTHHLVGESQLRAMKPGSYLVNTARGKVVDEKALVAAIASGGLAGAAIDVYETEPYEGPLSKFDNVVLTAHMGASAYHSRYLMELQAAEDCVRVLKGQPPVNPAADEDFGIRPKRLEGQYQPTLLDVAKAYEAIAETLPASRGGK